MTTQIKGISKQILTIVAEVTGVSESQILGKNRQMEVVDARHIYVQLLSLQGYYASCIAVLSGLTHRQVNKILSDFETRIKYSKYMRNNFVLAKNKLGYN